MTADDPATPLFTKGFDSDYIASQSGGDLIEFVQVEMRPQRRHLGVVRERDVRQRQP